MIKHLIINETKKRKEGRDTNEKGNVKEALNTIPMKSTCQNQILITC